MFLTINETPCCKITTPGDFVIFYFCTTSDSLSRGKYALCKMSLQNQQQINRGSFLENKCRMNALNLKCSVV